MFYPVLLDFARSDRAFDFARSDRAFDFARNDDIKKGEAHRFSFCFTFSVIHFFNRRHC
jgi:hypothetical protein